MPQDQRGNTPGRNRQGMHLATLHAGVWDG